MQTYRINALFAVILLLVGSSLLVQAGLVCTKGCSGTVFYDSSNGTYAYVNDVIDPQHGVAYGSFVDSLNTTGWGVLTISTSKSFSNVVQLHAAGVLEGVLTATRIYEEVLNMRYLDFGSPTGQASPAVVNFFNQQYLWTNTMISTHQGDPVWQQVEQVQEQLNGLMEGYYYAAGLDADLGAASTADNVTEFDFWLLQASGDYGDIYNAVTPSARPQWNKMSREEVRRTLLRADRCSALIKVPYDFSELYASHSTWFGYSQMNRIYKNYNFQVGVGGSNGLTQRMTFSSYPGFLESDDDFWQLDSGLVVMETTNDIINTTLYDLVTPSSLLSWQRVRVANALARDGRSWCNTMALYNSGTYNNQYQVVNYNLFTPGKPLPDNLLWICEQIPGYVHSADMTDQLRRGYFPSYNIPMFEDIYNMSGYPSLVANFGNEYTYQLCPRAQIFRRDQDSVHDLPSMQAIMRSNNYKNDPISAGNPSWAICARDDLADPKMADAGGCFDSKLTTSKMQATLSSVAISGPTYESLPPFVWSQSNFSHVPHYGQPDAWKFPWITMQPQWP